MSTDKIQDAFFRSLLPDAVDFNRRSDLARLHPQPGDPTRRYIYELNCRGLVRQPDGEIVEADHFEFGINFFDGYLRRSDPAALITCFRTDIWHPNSMLGTPFICLGENAPGLRLMDICLTLFEIVAYHKFNPASPLNEAAAEWARNNQHRFPLDRRSLLRPAALEKGGVA